MEVKKKKKKENKRWVFMSDQTRGANTLHPPVTVHHMSLDVTINMVACIVFTHSPTRSCMSRVAKKHTGNV